MHSNSPTANAIQNVKIFPVVTLPAPATRAGRGRGRGRNEEGEEEMEKGGK